MDADHGKPPALNRTFTLHAVWRGRGAAITCLVALAWLPSRAVGDAADSANAPADARILSPTLGRPILVSPGARFRVAARIPRGTEFVDLSLVRGSPPRRRYALAVDAATLTGLSEGRAVDVTAPPYIAGGTYDLELRCGNQTLLGRHCVAVGQFGRNIRIVHLGNLNVGDLGAPRFDQRLVNEINIVAPTLIVATGDYVDATHPNPDAGWEQLVEFLASFDAPVAAACGDHDDLAQYSRYLAPSPVGAVRVGPHRCVLLCDHGLAPIEQNPEQIRWFENLAAVASDGMTVVASHDGRPNLLGLWREHGVLTKMTHATRLGAWLAGGHRDWDGREYRELVDAAAPMAFFRTHQSSTAALEGATGVSRYRIIDIRDDRVVSPSAAAEPSAPPASTPVGRLAVVIEAANDGSQSELAFVATNALPYRLNDLATTVRLRKASGYKPWCQGGRLEQAVDLGEFWECRVRFDLPDKGMLRGRVGAGPPPSAEQVQATFDGPDKLRFTRRETPEGVVFYALASQPPTVRLTNAGSTPVAISPLVRLDGTPVAYRPIGEKAGFATAYRTVLRPGASVALQLDLSAVRVQPGRRELQAYIDLGGVVTPTCWPVEIEIVE